MRSKLLQVFFVKVGVTNSPYVYRPSNLDFEFAADGITISKQFDVVGYNSQFDATSFSLSVMKDAGVDIHSLKGVSTRPYSKFKAVSLISNSDQNVKSNE